MGKVNTNRSKKKEVCGGSGAGQLTGNKRKSEGTTLLANKDMNAKRSKNVAKKVCSERLEWDEEEELRVLQGMIDFKNLLRKNPFDDMKVTYEFIKEYTIFKPYSQEFVEKMDSLKKKLMDKWRKAEVPSSSERYDQKSSELLTLIWGNDVELVVEKPKKSKQIVKPKEEKQAVMIREGEKWFENASLVQQVVSRGVDKDSLNIKWDAVPMSKKNKMDQKWRLLRAKERESMPQKSKFFKELVSVIVGASSSSHLI